MLKKKNRLTTKEFIKTYKNKNKIFSENFIFTKTNSDNKKKISVVISKKIEKKAVSRILSRRKIYKILQENFTRISPNINIIILIKKPLLKINKILLEKELLFLFEKTNSLKK